ncbi:MAG: cytidine deaminase [Oscillospiraceae bacterium]
MNIELLISKALEARKMAYAPYSEFLVGAAVLTDDGEIFTGCNIECASYSGTNCAERTAIFKAVSEGKRNISAIAVVGGKKSEGESLSQFALPCGICRQVIMEFAEDTTAVIVAKSIDEYKIYKLSELLPFAFTKNNL